MYKRKNESSSSSNIPIVGSSTTSSTSSEIDAMMVTKLNGLSLKERDSGLHDLHGVSDKAGEEENYDMLQAKIQEMNRILLHDDETTATATTTASSRRAGGVMGGGGGGGLFNDDDSILPPPIKTTTTRGRQQQQNAYQIATMLNSKYVDEMKITCLRATESYEPEAAVGLLKRFFNRKLQLFGLDCLTREITQQDLFDYDPINAEDLLRKGLVQLLPYRDRAGRAIIFIDGKVNGNCTSTDLVVRVLFYMNMVPLRDIETQKRGVVIIYYGLDQTKKYADRPKELVANWNAFPFRTVAYHSCLGPKDIVLPSLKLYFSKVRSSNVSRTRLHTGTPMEVIYTLLTFGIPQDAIPVNTTDGSRDMSWHHTMLDMIQQREKYYHHYSSKTKKVASVEEPSSLQQPQSQTTTSRTNDSSYPEEFVDPFQLEEELNSCSSSLHLSYQPQHTEALVVEGEDLMTIPLPLSNIFDDEEDDDTAHHTDHNNNNNNKEEEEEEEEEESLILVPNPKDILLGKGRWPKSHQGNMKFHSLLEENYDIYNDPSLSKFDKKDFSQRLLQKLKSDGRRFLLPDKMKGGYIVVPDQIAREKITHGFRNLRIGRKKDQERKHHRQKQHPKRKNDI